MLPEEELLNSNTQLPAAQTYHPGENSRQRGLPVGSGSKEPTCNAGDLGLIPGLGRSPEEEMATHCSILAWRIPWTEERGGLQSMGSAKSQIRLSNFQFRFFTNKIYSIFIFSFHFPPSSSYKQNSPKCSSFPPFPSLSFSASACQGRGLQMLSHGEGEVMWG